MTDTTTITPPTITSTRPGSRPGLWRRRAIGSVASVRKISSAAARVSRKWWMRSLSLASTPSSIAPIVHTVPAVPISVLACAAPGTARSTSARWSRTTDTATLSSSALGGSECRNCSVSRTHPTSTEISPSGSSVPTMNSVEPPPTSTTR